MLQQTLDFQNKTWLNSISNLEHNQVIQGDDGLHKKEKLIILQ